MKTLIVEDEFILRSLMQNYLAPFGQCDVAINGKEAVAAFEMALQQNAPYDLICMDIMMPEMDGQEALQIIRQMEADRNIKGPQEVKVIMTTAVMDEHNVITAYYKGGATSYLVKPFTLEKLVAEIKSFGLI